MSDHRVQAVVPQVGVMDLRRSRYGAARGGSQAHYMSSGPSVYAEAGTLRARRVRAGPLEIHGSGAGGPRSGTTRAAVGGRCDAADGTSVVSEA